MGEPERGMSIESVKTWDQLIQFLEGWTTAEGDPDAYDIGGMLSILGACLTNLARFSIDADFEELGELYNPGQIDILRKLLNGAEMAAPSGT